MRFLYVRRCLSQFIRNKDYVFKDRSNTVKDVIKINAALLAITVPFVVLMEEFAFFTPDIVFDLRLMFSEDFRDFLRYKKHGGMTLPDKLALREYYVDVEHAAEAKRFGRHSRGIDTG